MNGPLWILKLLTQFKLIRPFSITIPYGDLRCLIQCIANNKSHKKSKWVAIWIFLQKEFQPIVRRIDNDTSWKCNKALIHSWPLVAAKLPRLVTVIYAWHIPNCFQSLYSVCIKQYSIVHWESKKILSPRKPLLNFELKLLLDSLIHSQNTYIDFF